MKKFLHFVLASLLSLPVLGQTQIGFDQEYTAVEKELTDWDPIRGKWLGASLKAMVADQPIPDRTFPEDFTPSEMLTKLPEAKVQKLRSIASTNASNSRDLVAREKWSQIEGLTRINSCSRPMARSYGDPHLKSFDGENFSFQTVGEFVMTRTKNQQFEVQTRQRPEGSDFSLNSAVAMNLGGDRVGFYMEDMPDGSDADCRINGQSVYLSAGTYYLPKGGTIRKEKRNFLITSPTGERVMVDIRGLGSRSYVDVSIEVVPCSNTTYAGVLGNANGDRRDDFGGNNGGRFISSGGNTRMDSRFEKERANFLIKDFANQWRVTPQTTLFEYIVGKNTNSYTDLSFPRVIYTMDDISADNRRDLENDCRRNGLTGYELDACVFDGRFLKIPPYKSPVIRDPSKNIVLGRVDKEKPNVNDREIKPVPPAPRPLEGDSPKPIVRPITDKNNTIGPGGNTNPQPIYKGDKDLKPRSDIETESGNGRSEGAPQGGSNDRQEPSKPSTREVPSKATSIPAPEKSGSPERPSNPTGVKPDAKPVPSKNNGRVEPAGKPGIGVPANRERPSMPKVEPMNPGRGAPSAPSPRPSTAPSVPARRGG